MQKLIEIQQNLQEVRFDINNHTFKVNHLPEKYEDIILPFMNMSDKLVLGGSLGLYLLDIMDYDFENRKPDIDFSLTETLNEIELSVLKDFYNLKLILRNNDYEQENIEYDPELHTYLPRDIKPLSHFLTKEIIQLYKLIPEDQPIDYAKEHWDKEYIIDLFNSNYVKTRDIVKVKYKDGFINVTHPSVILSHKSRYAYDNRVGKQYKHFTDIKSLNWDKYFAIVKRIQQEWDEDNKTYRCRYGFEQSSKVDYLF